MQSVTEPPSTGEKVMDDVIKVVIAAIIMFVFMLSLHPEFCIYWCVQP